VGRRVGFATIQECADHLHQLLFVDGAAAQFEILN
jgi:hypothetical protein